MYLKQQILNLATSQPDCAMQNYTILKELGSGTYGTVYQAVHNQTRQIVAIKQIHQKTSWNEAKNLVELKSFKKIRAHPNIVTLHELFREKDGTLYFVFELINQGSLYDYILKCQRVNRPPTENEIKAIGYQFLVGLAHIHNNSFIHRDLKLENVLMQADDSLPNLAINLQQSSQPLIPKIADLGCAKETRVRFANNTLYTGTRWYRSIELLMRDTTYGKPNDVWAVGCILIELFTLRPLFAGQSELDMLHLILQQLGPLYENEWPDYQTLAGKMNFVSTVQLSSTKYTTGASHTRIKDRLTQVLKNASSDFVDCVSYMMELSPDRRWDCNQLLNHPWFKSESLRTGLSFGTTQKPPTPTKERVSPEGNSTLNKAKQLMSKHTPSVDFDSTQTFDIDVKPVRSQSTGVNVNKTIQSTKQMLGDNKELDANLDMLDDMDY
ncbi:Kinase [Hexamita inflata]|uniref:Kinase n=1 Tax=Hexamita inflata TaxID=28002 RepID=A0ABP1HLE6_9EUKA